MNSVMLIAAASKRGPVLRFQITLCELVAMLNWERYRPTAISHIISGPKERALCQVKAKREQGA